MLIKSLKVLIGVLLFSCGLQSQNKTKKTGIVEPISYCELFQHPDQYSAGQQTRIKATWTYGFEWSYLSFRDCLNVPRALVDFVDDGKLCAASKPNLKKIDHKGFNNKADVTVVGELRDCGGCGHMGSYRYKFVVTCLENYKKIPPNVP